MARMARTETQSAQGHIRAEIRAELGRQGVLPADLARQLGWSSEVLSKRLRGTTEFRGSELSRIAEILDVPVSQFFPTPTPTAS